MQVTSQSSSNGALQKELLLEGSAIQKDQWVHIAGVIDRLAGNATYVNGAQAGTSTLVRTPAADISLGNWVLGDSDQANMELDEVRLANTHRSGDWIKALLRQPK